MDCRYLLCFVRLTCIKKTFYSFGIIAQLGHEDLPMNNSVLIVIFLVLPISSAFAASKGDNYGGLQYSQVTYDEDDFDEAEPTALVGRIGQFINESAAIEADLVSVFLMMK